MNKIKLLFIITFEMIFVLFCPFLLGGTLLILPNMWFRIDPYFSILIYIIFTIIWFSIWAGYYDEGRNFHWHKN